MSNTKFATSAKRVNEAAAKIKAARRTTIMIDKREPTKHTPSAKNKNKSSGRLITQTVTINGKVHERKLFVPNKTPNQEFIAKMNMNLKK